MRASKSSPALVDSTFLEKPSTKNEPVDFSHVPNHIAAWRRYRGNMLQRTLASAAMCSPQTISNAERGQPISTDILQRIAFVLGVKPGWLLDCDPYDDTDVWTMVEELQRKPEEAKAVIAFLKRFPKTAASEP